MIKIKGKLMVRVELIKVKIKRKMIGRIKIKERIRIMVLVKEKRGLNRVQGKLKKHCFKKMKKGLLLKKKT